jgi:hypothetical protein
VDAAYPDRYLKQRPERTLRAEKDNSETLLEYWNGQPWNKLSPTHWDDYAIWRRTTVKNGCTGDRSIDSERVTLSNAFRYSIRRGLVTANPVIRQSNRIVDWNRHCRAGQSQGEKRDQNSGTGSREPARLHTLNPPTYPERFAQQHLGRNSKAVHHAYAKDADVIVPSLED